MPENTNQLSGFLIIDKPEGLTSHDVVDQVRKIIRVGLPPEALAKVGHAGTLDPFATGVLLVAIGSATRLLEYAKGFSKIYEVEMTLGATSDTDDKTATITPKSSRIPDLSEIERTLSQFLGPIQQIPPIYSAVKVRGKKLYEIARSGNPADLSAVASARAEAQAKAGERARSVTIHSITLLSYQYPLVQCEVHCSSGTYIRALARDIGENLGIGSYVSHLRRKVIHKFHITEATPLEKLSPDILTAALKPPEALVEHLQPMALNSENVAKFKRGQAIEPSGKTLTDTPLAIFDESDHFVGIGQVNAGNSLL
ncbi:MAG: tRNA pseudouridine(55) synthase TruB, partial [Patescibacteria group bacterium]